MAKKRQYAPGTMAEKLYREALEDAQRKAAAALLGRAGGLKGGKSAQALRTPARRRKIGQKGAAARWEAVQRDPAALADWKAKIQAGRREAREAQRIAGAALDDIPAGNTAPPETVKPGADNSDPEDDPNNPPT